jgi:hypothetical protein
MQPDNGAQLTLKNNPRTLPVTAATSQQQQQLAQQRLIDDTTVRPSDILSGRGKTVFHHPGNKTCRDLLALQLGTYESADIRAEKSVLVNAIVEALLSEGARFLKRDDKDKGKWRIMNKKEARNKVAHSVRDLLADKVKCMTRNGWSEKSRAAHQHDHVVLASPKTGCIRRVGDMMVTTTSPFFGQQQLSSSAPPVGGRQKNILSSHDEDQQEGRTKKYEDIYKTANQNQQATPMVSFSPTLVTATAAEVNNTNAVGDWCDCSNEDAAPSSADSSWSVLQDISLDDLEFILVPPLGP